MTLAVIAARAELRAAALRFLSAEALDGNGANDDAEQQYADENLTLAALHLTAAVATSDDPRDRPIVGWKPQPLREPVPAKGALGVWTLPDDVERAVRKQLPAPAVPL